VATVPNAVAHHEPPLIKTLPQLSEQNLVKALAKLSPEEIRSEYGHDPWLANYFVNWWEYLNGVAELSTYPWNVTIPIADVCNARCTFCTSWLAGTRVVGLEEIDNFAEVLRHARLIGIAGHGEPLAHPQCEEVFARIGSYTDSRAQSYIITNGVFLERRRKALESVHITTYNISLNAATAKTHDVVMGLGADAFGNVLEAIRYLIHTRDSRHPSQPKIFVNISFVLTRDNIQEAADFVSLGNELGVDNIYLRTLMPIEVWPEGLNYHLLPPYLHPEFPAHVAAAKVAIAASKANVVADPVSWSAPVLSKRLEELVQLNPPSYNERKTSMKDKAVRSFYSEDFEGEMGRPLEGAAAAFDLFDDSNPFGRKAHFHCYFVYHDLILNDFNFRMIPCCYMREVPGFESVRFNGKQPFMAYWNSPAFVTLRRRLKEGPLYGACRRCPAQAVPFE